MSRPVKQVYISKESRRVYVRQSFNILPYFLSALIMHNCFSGMKFLYPYGATLNVVQPSVVALSSGSIAIPMNRPICAYHCVKTSGGKLVVLGSSKMLADTYIEKENNDALREMIFDFFELDITGIVDLHTDDVEVCLLVA